jgi:large subunit ribosomal protein L4
LWRGGGTIFGPKPRDFSWRPPAKIRREALKIVLTSKLTEKELLVLDNLRLNEIKTKSFMVHMNNLGLSNALIIIPFIDPKLELSSRNLQEFKVLRADGLNCYDLLKYDKVVLLKDSLAPIETRLDK